jgi:hypothetical protein
MKKIIGGIILSVFGLLAPQIIEAQGTITYLSNLGQASTGSDAVGSNSWLAAGFGTGTNVSGYLLNSIQLAMTAASGSPSGFTVMVYANSGPAGISPGSSLGTLSGSTDPATSGIFAYTPTANLTLSPSAFYYIVLTSGTAVSNGAFEWSLAGANSYNPSDGWFSLGGVWTSSNGSSWPSPIAGNLQFAVTATAVPEPSSEILLGLGGVFLFSILSRRRKTRAN